MFNCLVVECLESYASSQKDQLKRDIVLEALKLGSQNINGLVRRVTKKLNCDIKTVRETMLEASKYKNEQLPIRYISENIKE